MTEEQRRTLSGEVLGLITEQLTARVVHYRADLKTNAELDAITAGRGPSARATGRSPPRTGGGYLDLPLDWRIQLNARQSEPAPSSTA